MARRKRKNQYDFYRDYHKELETDLNPLQHWVFCNNQYPYFEYAKAPTPKESEHFIHPISVDFYSQPLLRDQYYQDISRDSYVQAVFYWQQQDYLDYLLANLPDRARQLGLQV